jgi:hypothetical protein
VSTRKLIIAALVCGMVILLAGAVQFIQIANTRNSGGGPSTSVAPAPRPVTTAAATTAGTPASSAAPSP